MDFHVEQQKAECVAIYLNMPTQTFQANRATG